MNYELLEAIPSLSDIEKAATMIDRLKTLASTSIEVRAWKINDKGHREYYYLIHRDGKYYSCIEALYEDYPLDINHLGYHIEVEANSDPLIAF